MNNVCDYQTCINLTFCAFIIKWCFYCWKLLVILFLLLFLTKGIDMDMVSTKRSNIVVYYVFKGLWRLLLTSFPDNTSNEGFIKSLLFWFVLGGWSNVGCILWYNNNWAFGTHCFNHNFVLDGPASGHLGKLGADYTINL